MATVALIFQVVIALGIFNVWFLRYNRATPFRPEGATSMADEFARYGFPRSVEVLVGVTKVTLAVLLLVGTYFAPVTRPAAAIMAVLMVAALVSHLRIGNPLAKAVPAMLMLLMSTVVVVVSA